MVQQVSRQSQVKSGVIKGLITPSIAPQMATSSGSDLAPIDHSVGRMEEQVRGGSARPQWSARQSCRAMRLGAQAGVMSLEA